MNRCVTVDRRYQQCPNLSMAGKTIRLRISLISNLFWTQKFLSLQMVRFNLQLMDGMLWIRWADGRQGSAHFRLLKKCLLPTG